MIVPSNTPESSNILEICDDTNMELYEPNNNCEHVSELSDDNKGENNIEARFKLSNTIIEEPTQHQLEEPKELPLDEVKEILSDEETDDEPDEEPHEVPIENNNIMFQPINESNKKKKNKKKKNKNITNNIENITI
jgi:hypothetical protein